MTDNTQPEALRLAEQISDIRCQTEDEARTIAAAADLLCHQHTRIAELEAQIEALSGVQALSAAPRTPTVEQVEDEVSMGHGAWDMVDPQELIGAVLRLSVAASPTPPAEQQAAPKAEPEVGNSGFDHKTAADLLNGKTVSDEAVRKFVAASRWAHDERAALSATLLAMHGVLTSREAEIALLKKALLEAEAAPQPAPAPLSDDTKRLDWMDKDAGERVLHLGACWYTRLTYGQPHRKQKNLRAAIDAAIAAQGGKDAE